MRFYIRNSIALASFLAGSLRNSGVAAATSCYDSGSGFDRNEWAHCQVIREELFLYYTPMESKGNVMIGLHAPKHTNGWSALALAGNGGMKGASQIIVRKEGEEWVAEDRYSEDYTTPTLDESQDVKLLFATQSEDSGTSWGVLTVMDSCDDRDYPIDDRSMWMQWALGYAHDFSFHGTGRGQFHANLMRAPSVDTTIGNTTDEVLDFTMPAVPVVRGDPEEDPTNPYICSFFDLHEVMREQLGTDNGSEKLHITRFSPHLDPQSSRYVHHMVLYSCDGKFAEESGYEHLKTIPECQSMPQGCSEMKWVWAVGGQDVIFPDDVGMPLGGQDPEADGEHHNRWVVLQMHYYNPSLDEDIVDSSGVRVRFTHDLRPIEAGVMQFASGVWSGQRSPMPAGQEEVVLSPLVVPPTCTESWSEPLNIVGLMHHEHLVGKQLQMEVERDGRNLGPLRLERLFDFNHQSMEETSPAIGQLMPGDSLVMTCQYDTSSRTEDVVFGELSQQEMCYAALIYYPKQKHDAYFYTPEGEKGIESKYMQGKIATCTQPGSSDEFRNMSACTEHYVTDVFDFLGWKEGINVTLTAVEFCNSAEFPVLTATFLCPPCSETKTCTMEEIVPWGQDEVCAKKCREAGGLSLYPDTSSTEPSDVTTSTSCSLSPVYFDHVPLAPPTCKVKGDLNDVAEISLQETRSDTTTGDQPSSGGFTTISSMLLSIALFSTTTVATIMG